jgi:hypothetical protein
VALPQLRLRASCADDVALGCASFEVILAEVGEHITGNAHGIDQDVSLAAFDGQVVKVSFQATDDLGRTTAQDVLVYVDASRRLSKVAEVTGPGTILDATEDRLLVSDTISQREQSLRVLAIQQRATGHATDILSRSALDVYHAHLAPRGAVFGAMDGTMIHTYEWRDNTLLDLGIEAAFAVDEPYMAWGLYPEALYRRHLESGATTPVPEAASNALADVGPNGDVLYWSPGLDLRRFRNGATTTIVPAILTLGPVGEVDLPMV